MNAKAIELFDTTNNTVRAMLNMIIDLEQEAQSNEQRIKELEDENHELQYRLTRLLKQTQ